MRATRTRLTTAIVVALALTACGGGDDPEAAGDTSGSVATSDGAGDDATGGTTAEPPVAAACDGEVSVTGPAGWTAGELTTADDAVQTFVRDHRDLGSQDAEADVAAAEAAGISAATTQQWSQPSTYEGREDFVSLTLATAADETAAAAEFDRLRAQAEAANAAEFRAIGEAAFAVRAGTMVQINPNTGEQEGPTPRGEVVVATDCDRIAIAYVFTGDEADYDPALADELAAQLASGE